MSVTAFHLFKKIDGMPDAKVHAVIDDIEKIQGNPLLCIICHKLITSEAETVEISGQHFHTCTNPANIVFNIRCFTLAPGCTPVGMATFEHTWFNGYCWQIVLCKDCGEHLGWYFKNSGSFYGLIADRLISE